MLECLHCMVELLSLSLRIVYHEITRYDYLLDKMVNDFLIKVRKKCRTSEITFYDFLEKTP